MSKTDFTAEIFNAASLHLDVVDEFIAIAQAKLAGATGGSAPDFARDSLSDLLDGLAEQREAYRATIATRLAATAPAVTALAA